MRTKAIAILMTCAVPAAIGAQTDIAKRPNQWGYDYPRAYDAEISAAQAHRLRYEDDHIQFLEVMNPPGYAMQMHGHPYPSIFARMSGGTTTQGLSSNEKFLDPDSPRNGQGWRQGGSPKGLLFPNCTAADPQAPHLPFNDTPAPLHFYRVEFKQMDQLRPAAAKAYAKAPLEQVRYESEAVRLVEVTIPAGGAEPARPDGAVLAFDTVAAFDALDKATGPDSGRSPPPENMVMPRCMTFGPGQQGRVANTGRAPLHFYRIEFKRIDGDGLRDHWREWYPEMAGMK